MTEAELQAIEERAKEASPGPWFAAGGEVKTVGLLDPDNPKRGRELIADVHNGFNQQFIAAARTDVEKLCEEVRRLQVDVGSCTSRWHHYKQRTESAEAGLQTAQARVKALEAALDTVKKQTKRGTNAWCTANTALSGTSSDAPAGAKP